MTILFVVTQDKRKMAEILELNGWYYVKSNGKLIGALLTYQEALELKEAQE